MLAAYNESYRERLKTSGTPTRRELAEAIMQAVIEQVETDPSAAKVTLRAAAEILRSVEKNGKPVFNNDGVKKRIAAVANTLPPTNP